MSSERGLRIERPLFGCRGVLSENGITQEIRDRTTVVHASKPNSGRFVRLGGIVLALQDEVRPRLVASPHHVAWILHRHLRVSRSLSGRDPDHTRKKAGY